MVVQSGCSVNEIIAVFLNDDMPEWWDRSSLVTSEPTTGSNFNLPSLALLDESWRSLVSCMDNLNDFSLVYIQTIGINTRLYMPYFLVPL